MVNLINMSTRESTTLIRIKRSTKQELKDFGAFGDSYDDVIQRLLKFRKENIIREYAERYRNGEYNEAGEAMAELIKASRKR